jgi:cyclopropane-fatty-acyl-phospholipid synthase
VNDEATLETAQAAKHDLICRKLGLGERSNMSLLDVGCGWGSMAMHAASRYGAKAVGITISKEQASLARRRVDEAGLSDRVEIRLQDYRELKGEEFDAISSIGMFEHVGSIRTGEYLTILWDFLAPEGRLLNHAISSPGGSKISRRSFIGRYVFPDGELMDVGQVILDMENVGFEIRDVESLREHYSKTLHAWVENLQGDWAEAVSTAGEARARIWLLYMAASANGFDDGGLAVHQVLGVKPSPGGCSGMPFTRRDWG